MKISRVRIKRGSYAYVHANFFESIFLYIKMSRRKSGLIPIDIMPRLIKNIAFLERVNYVLVPRNVKNHKFFSDELKAHYYN